MIEPVTTVLGLTVAKAVFKAWFKDHEFASSVSESAVEYLRGSISDKRALGAAERQLARISEKATDALESYIDFEWVDLARDEKIDAINVVQNAIDGIGISAALMASLEFNTDRLVVLVVSRLVDGGLSPDAKSLANTLARESAQMISDLASSLPEFHRETYAEVLKREVEIINRLDRVFEEVQAIRNSVNINTVSAAASIFEQAYRRSVARELDTIELFGMDSGFRQSSRQHSLSTAYISLSVSGGVDVHLESEENDIANDADVLQDKKAVFSVRAEEAANLSKLVVIKGEAGSGKTTLLQSLAVRSATASYENEMEHWNSLIPFFVRLRALSNNALPSPEDLPGLVAPIISGIMPNGWVHSQLENGRGLILVDGLDEISPERRDLTRKWIGSLLSEYPESRVVITSRPTAIPDDWLLQRDFRQLELLPMSPDDVSVFIDHWHAAVSNEEQDTARRSSVIGLVPSLKDRIRSDRALRELAGTPLLCAMLCAMNRDRKQVLPTNRIALYDAAVQMILHGRDEERRIKVPSLVSLDFATKQSLVQEIAFWMMQNGASMADQWRIEDFVASVMPGFTKIPSSASSREIVNSLIQRSGIVRSPIEGKVDFVHNAFKEYLCAKAISSGDRFGYLQSVLAHEAWREVAVLAVAMTDEVRRSEFISQLLERGDRDAFKKTTLHLLAVRCLETCTQLDPDLQEGIKTRLRKMSSPASLTEARSLSSAGELALPLLKHSGNQYARTAASCVRALRLIGTPEALNYIAAYASDRRATVAKEVISAWPFFDISDYAANVLSKSFGIYGNIRIDYPDYLLGIRFLTSIFSLNISLRNCKVPEWAILDVASLSSLVRVSISSKYEIDITEICNMPDLSILTIACDAIEGVEKISSLNKIARLSLSGVSSNPLDLEKLPDSLRALGISGNVGFIGRPKDGHQLAELNLGNVGGAIYLDLLAEFRNLTTLALRVVDSEEDLSAIALCKNLRSLTISNLKSIGNLDFISNLSCLEKLHISAAAELTNIDALDNLKNLEVLIIRRAPNLIDLDVISNISSLSEVSLLVSEQANIEPLLENSSLKHVQFGQHMRRYVGGTAVR